MKNVFIVILAIILLGGGLLLYQNSQTPVQTTPQPTVSETTKAPGVSIEYTDEGFNPNIATVKSGTTVTWNNSSSKPMWVASSPHPQHTDLPGFDALRGFETGEKYSYTFTKVGAWKFHDHLNATKFGRVDVTP